MVTSLSERIGNWPVTLHCNVSSSVDNLLIRYLSWINENNEAVCIFEEGKLNQSSGDINCSYADQRLTLQFVHTPLHESQGLHKYLCKLRSNQGARWKNTTVKLKECCQEVEVAVTTEGEPTCTFTGVYPDGEVHWFHAAARLPASNAMAQNKKREDERGYMSVISSLPGGGHAGPYNCCLWNTECQTHWESGTSGDREWFCQHSESEADPPLNQSQSDMVHSRR
ncbi:hypothetical protein CRUP_027599 [Coryphaenoides rupestris]|nr:hypothetical protein CRUP_027599 [Coryphaenoides rupestris]